MVSKPRTSDRERELLHVGNRSDPTDTESKTTTETNTTLVNTHGGKKFRGQKNDSHTLVPTRRNNSSPTRARYGEKPSGRYLNKLQIAVDIWRINPLHEQDQRREELVRSRESTSLLAARQDACHESGTPALCAPIDPHEPGRRAKQHATRVVAALGESGFRRR